MGSVLTRGPPVLSQQLGLTNALHPLQFDTLLQRCAEIPVMSLALLVGSGAQHRARRKSCWCRVAAGARGLDYPSVGIFHCHCSENTRQTQLVAMTWI